MELDLLVRVFIRQDPDNRLARTVGNRGTPLTFFHTIIQSKSLSRRQSRQCMVIDKYKYKLTLIILKV
jgi:hypothetical protein